MTTQEVADKAHNNYEQTLLCRAHLQGSFLKLGSLLKECRDESLFKFLGHDSFESYLGTPELKFKRSTAYKLIGTVELYLDKLSVDPERLIRIGTTNLDKIKKVVEQDVDGWLDKAEHLSVSSLSSELGQGPGEPSLPPVPGRSLGSNNGPLDGCVNGCAGETQKSHFPITRGAGGEEVKDWWIPMCPRCHQDYHQNEKEWTWKYRRNWAKWFYSRLNRGE